MKYKSGDHLLYVNPFVFTIDKVNIEYAYKDDYGLVYIDCSGAYLAEDDLFLSLEEAREHALIKLEYFYQQKYQEIVTQNPTFSEE
ncbi:MAG: hypothetical protein AABY22_10860 [Nanoarchaeota archaeon]